MSFRILRYWLYYCSFAGMFLFLNRLQIQAEIYLLVPQYFRLHLSWIYQRLRQSSENVGDWQYVSLSMVTNGELMATLHNTSSTCVIKETICLVWPFSRTPIQQKRIHKRTQSAYEVKWNRKKHSSCTTFLFSCCNCRVLFVAFLYLFLQLSVWIFIMLSLFVKYASNSLVYPFLPEHHRRYTVHTHISIVNCLKQGCFECFS